MRDRDARPNRALTSIELLVVIGIIASLSSLLAPDISISVAEPSDLTVGGAGPPHVPFL